MVDGFFFLCRSFLVLCSLVYFCFFFWCEIQKIIAKIDVEEMRRLPHMFSPTSFMFSGLTFKSFIHFEFFVCVWIKIGVQFHSFACVYPVFPTPFIEETILSPFFVYPWLLYHKLMDHIGIHLFLSPLFCSIALCICFYANTILY